MVLVRFWSSLPTMLKFSMLTSWPDLMEWSYIGEGAFWCSLNLSANNLADSPMYSSSHSTLSQVYLYMTLKRSCSRFGVQVHFKGGLTIKDLLMAPKDKDHILKKSGVIYKYTCDKVECDEEYIGESARLFAERFKEHQKAPSPIYDHSIRSGHEVNIENFSIVGREDQNLTRTIKEALYIRVNNPSLNKNIGKYHLPHIWDEVLCNSTELKL